MRCDRVFVLGDFGYFEHLPQGVEFLDRLNTYANILNVQVYFLDGNHDKTSMILERYGDQLDHEGFLLVRPYIRYAPRGHRWVWDGCRFVAFGGAYSVDKSIRLVDEKENSWPPGTSWFPEEEMSDEDMYEFLKDDEQVDIILAHDKPRSSNPGPSFKDHPLCIFNQDRLQRALTQLGPRYFFHGHLHYAYEDRVYPGESRPHWTKVIGIDCNGTHGRSWRIFNTDAAKEPDHE
jgi:hypothetical protein